jgi:hypothetical protein
MLACDIIELSSFTLSAHLSDLLHLLISLNVLKLQNLVAQLQFKESIC